MRILVLLFVAAAFAGCLDQPVEIDEDTFTLTSTATASAFAGFDYTFTLDAEGPSGINSDHIGAHYWMTPTADPQTDFDGQAGACNHIDTGVARSHLITCKWDQAGTYHVYGHIRVTADGEPINYWADGFRVDVHDFDLASATTQGDATVGQPFQFTMTTTGGPAATSDHVGAHYWTSPVADPTASFADRAGNCDHGSAGVPGEHTVTCTWESAGTYVVYGHMRLTDGPNQANYWTDAITVTVSEAASG